MHTAYVKMTIQPVKASESCAPCPRIEILFQKALDKGRYYLSEDWFCEGVEVESILSRVHVALDEIFDEPLSGNCDFLPGNGFGALWKRWLGEQWRAMSDLLERIREKQAFLRGAVMRGRNA